MLIACSCCAFQGLEAAEQPAAADAAAAAVQERLQTCRDRLAAARQLEACWEGLCSSWPPPPAEPDDLIAAAAAAAYGGQPAGPAAAPADSGSSHTAAQLHLLQCADMPARWAAAELPPDQHLIASAARMRHAQRLPVMADPEGFGAAWVRYMHKDDAKLQVWLPY